MSDDLEYFQEMEEKASKMAMECMVSKRKNDKKLKWEHPEDVVYLLDELVFPYGQYSEIEKSGLRTVAWLHDILEDGVTSEDGMGTWVSVIPRHLINRGFGDGIIAGILWLTRDKKESKRQYLLNLAHAPIGVKVIKVLDRIANLKDGIRTMNHDWLHAYKLESQMYIKPLIEDIKLGRVKDAFDSIIEKINKEIKN